ncbi:MAG: hypothetical protein ACLFVB_07080 [Thermoplasmata archaeon]
MVGREKIDYEGWQLEIIKDSRDSIPWSFKQVIKDSSYLPSLIYDSPAVVDSEMG